MQNSGILLIFHNPGIKAWPSRDPGIGIPRTNEGNDSSSTSDKQADGFAVYRLLLLTRARFAGGVAGVRSRLEKPRPRLENISKNAAGVAF